ncbi:MAG: OmpA family protein [Phaeospirillum sp.]|nr:OmpA family protein [Phaeospirillum sp.]
MLALGVLASVAASPVGAQMVIGGSRPSVDVNWDVLDKLGPEPTLPGLVTRKPQPVKPAASTHQGVVFKPYGGGPAVSASAAAVAPRVVKPAKEKVAKVVAPEAVASKVAKPVVEEPKIAEIASVPPMEKTTAPAQPPKPPKVELAAEVPPPPKAAAKSAPESKVAVPPAPVPVAPPPPAPAKVEPVPSAIQFAKAPEAPPAIVAPAPLPLPVVVAPPPAPVAPPAPVVQPSALPQQLAAVAPAVSSPVRKGDNLSVLFAVESEHLPDSARSDLEKLAQKMERDDGLTLQLLAYAAGDEANASKARRLSLTRALKVRTYLMELGVRSTRIEVRALGNKIEGGAADRVDLVLGNR